MPAIKEATPMADTRREPDAHINNSSKHTHIHPRTHRHTHIHPRAHRHIESVPKMGAYAETEAVTNAITLKQLIHIHSYCQTGTGIKAEIICLVIYELSH